LTIAILLGFVIATVAAGVWWSNGSPSVEGELSEHDPADLRFVPVDVPGDVVEFEHSGDE
jgi:hypothetical protein